MIDSRGIELRPGSRRSDFVQQCDYRNPRLLDTRRRVLRRVPHYPGGPLETELNARECDGKATQRNNCPIPARRRAQKRATASRVHVPHPATGAQDQFCPRQFPLRHVDVPPAPRSDGDQARRYGCEVTQEDQTWLANGNTLRKTAAQLIASVRASPDMACRTNAKKTGRPKQTQMRS